MAGRFPVGLVGQYGLNKRPFPKRTEFNLLDIAFTFD